VQERPSINQKRHGLRARQDSSRTRAQASAAVPQRIALGALAQYRNASCDASMWKSTLAREKTMAPGCALELKIGARRSCSTERQKCTQLSNCTQPSPPPRRETAFSGVFERPPRHNARWGLMNAACRTAFESIGTARSFSTMSGLGKGAHGRESSESTSVGASFCVRYCQARQIKLHEPKRKKSRLLMYGIEYAEYDRLRQPDANCATAGKHPIVLGCYCVRFALPVIQCAQLSAVGRRRRNRLSTASYSMTSSVGNDFAPWAVSSR
jgi:hypothetical protein